MRLPFRPDYSAGSGPLTRIRMSVVSVAVNSTVVLLPARYFAGIDRVQDFSRLPLNRFFAVTITREDADVERARGRARSRKGVNLMLTRVPSS